MSGVPEWFERQIADVIWKAITDSVASWTETKINDELAKLEPGHEITSGPPLVKVLRVDATTITFFVRGRMSLFECAESAFMRVEVVALKKINLTTKSGRPITIKEWRTIVGDLKLSHKHVAEVNLAFGYDRGSWLGRGALKVLPAGFGLDVLLGGLNERGAMVGFDVDLPVPVPLGSTGLSLAGIGGDFAYNFVPRLEKTGEVAARTADQYVNWARNHEVDRWQAGPIHETSVGLALRADLRTMSDNGLALTLEPIGFALLTPGPVMVIGGAGRIVKTKKVEGYFVVDIDSKSIALGLGVEIKFPNWTPLYALKTTGTLDAFFSFRSPTLSYVNLGTEEEPIKAEVLGDLIPERGDVWVMIDSHRIYFGVGVAIGGDDFEILGIIRLVARLSMKAAALIGWNPVQLQGKFAIWGELGLKVWKFSFVLSGKAEAVGHTPEPTKAEFTLSYKLDLPWPIPDVEGEAKLPVPEDEPKAGPSVASPLQVGTAKAGAAATSGELKLGAVHALTGRQWQLDPGVKAPAPWPDLEIVLPFTRCVGDKTGKVIGPAVSPELQGGYEVKHHLQKLELFDLERKKDVPGVKAVWAAGPGGDTARLHVLGEDPFAWLAPHTDTILLATETPPKVVEQRFGAGPRESFASERRFGETLLKPVGEAVLVTTFGPELPTRVLQFHELRIRFRTSEGSPVEIDQLVTYLLVGDHPGEVLGPGVPSAAFTTSLGDDVSLAGVKSVAGGLSLVAVTIHFSGAHDEITIRSLSDAPLLLFALRYREARKLASSAVKKTVLVPGKYRLTAQGQSTATHVPVPEDPRVLPAATPVDWRVERSFTVAYPESLRPYIRDTTIGDGRLFLVEPHAWNPTMYGVGFPAYRSYVAVVHFLVPYMSKIFSPITLRVLYERGPMLVKKIAPTKNPDGISSLPESSKSWIVAAGGTVAADEEIAFTAALPKRGAATVSLLFAHSGAPELRLDEWTCYVSRFVGFRQHLGWDGSCLQTFYDAAGLNRRARCPSISVGKKKAKGSAPRWAGSRMETGRDVLATEVDLVAEAVVTKDGNGPLLGISYPTESGVSYPDELAATPVSWALPTALRSQLGPLDAASPLRFARFAQETQARFNDSGTGEKLDGIQDTVDTTTVEAVVDPEGRPYALWLRTPEPVDWRRVTASLRIRHVEQAGACPTAYSRRRPLDLQIAVLPSPDATSGFLTGSLAGVPTRLPRGEFELTLTFDPHVAGMPRLRPGVALGAGSEIVVLKFVQPSGEDWPRPETLVVVPAQFVELMIERSPIPPEAWLDVYSGTLPPKELRRAPDVGIEPVPVAGEAPGLATAREGEAAPAPLAGDAS